MRRRDPFALLPAPLGRAAPLFASLGLALILAGCEANTAPAPISERPVQVQIGRASCRERV